MNNLEELPEKERNDRLRRLDWRFLVPSGEQVPEIEEVAGAGRRRLRAARASLGPGGVVACRRRLALPGGAWLLRRALERAGFVDVRIYWPGPVPSAPPKFWLAVGSDAATEHLLEQRPAEGILGAALRPAWRLARRLGALAPLWALARVPGGRTPAFAESDWLLLTGGNRSINKVVGLPFGAAGGAPTEVVKFARTGEAERALDREAEMLRFLERERPGVDGVPRVVADGRRGGRRALGESAVRGRALLSELSPQTFPELAGRVTDWLVALADRPAPAPPEEWWPRLVSGPLEELSRGFGAVLEPGDPDRAEKLLDALGPLPIVPEHRDCSPWNVLIAPGRSPALLDWESSEPHGLPALDLVYFLTQAVLRMESGYELPRARELYASILDPATPYGRTAAKCLGTYLDAVGVDRARLPALRLLCWIVHCRSDRLHLEMEAAGEPSPVALRGSLFLALAKQELALAQAGGG